MSDCGGQQSEFPRRARSVVDQGTELPRNGDGLPSCTTQQTAEASALQTYGSTLGPTQVSRDSLPTVDNLDSPPALGACGKSRRSRGLRL